jgi:hypothetical protein
MDVSIEPSTKLRPRRAPTIEPICVTMQDAEHASGLGSTKLGELVRDGRIESVLIDGRRLVVYASLKRLLTPAAEAIPT